MPREKLYDRRTDRLSATTFVIACEGERTEEIYFRHVTDGLRRVRVIPLSTGRDGKSSPAELIERLSRYFAGNEPDLKGDVQAWIVFDVDHHFNPSHWRGTHEALDKARQSGYGLAISNPCIELWLLLHLEDVTDECDETHCSSRLKVCLGGYNHAKYDPSKLAPGIGAAIERARTLDTSPASEKPTNPGSRIYELMEKLRAVVSANGGTPPF